MRPYETAFLIAPNLADEDIESLIQSMADAVAKKKGKMENIDKWGKRRLAYPIKKFEEAHYVFFLYRSEPDVPDELDRLFKQTESVIRHMTFVLDERDNTRLKKKAAAKKSARSGAQDRPERTRPQADKKPPAEEKETAAEEKKAEIEEKEAPEKEKKASAEDRESAAGSEKPATGENEETSGTDTRKEE